MSRTVIVILTLLVSLHSEGQNSSINHVGSFGMGITSYNEAPFPILAPFIGVDSDWGKGFKSEVQFEVRSMGNELAFGIKAGLRKTLSDKLSISSNTNLANGDWQPNLSQQIGLAIKVDESLVLSGSGSVYFGVNRKPLYVLNASILKTIGQSSFSLKFFNQINDADAFNPTLAISYIHASKKGNVLAIFGQAGFQSALDNVLGAGTQVLYHRGGGIWFKLNFGEAFYVLGSLAVDAYSGLDAGSFASSSFRMSFHIK